MENGTFTADSKQGIPASIRSRVFLSYSLLSTDKKIKICRNIILRVVLYGCETWSVILREERRLKEF